MTFSSSFPARLVGPLVLVLGVVAMGGCDAVPGGEAGGRQSPRVSNLQVVTDTVQISDENASARLTIDLAVRAADPDGMVDRVVFLLEPASTPRSTVSGELRAVEGSLYAGRIQLSVPLAEEIFTVRAFAVDNDSLTSNQVTGQFRFDPPPQSDASAAQLHPGAADSFMLRAVRSCPLNLPSVQGYRCP